MTETIRQSYDNVPYPSLPRQQTHPNTLAALAKLFGMTPTPVDRCRVLDLGCGNGSNLIPMADQWPASEFMGLDFSAKQIAEGQARIETLGLRNISLHTQDILQISPDDLGQFDYIILYGVYSWVPDEVRTKILKTCRHCLSPHGVAYISYNVYPGWHIYGPARAAMLYHSRDVSDQPYERVKKARAALDFYTKMIPQLSRDLPETLEINRLIFKNTQDLLENQPDEYLLHDHLETINQPFHFHEFVNQAERHGLQYLTDVESSIRLKRYLPADFLRSIEGLAQTEVELEQLLDFLYMRAFRQTLLCREKVPLNREITPDSLRGVFMASPARPVGDTVELHSSQEAVFRGAIGTQLATEQPLNKAALLCLADLWPQAVSFEELIQMARVRLNPEAGLVYSATKMAEDVQTVGELLLKGFVLNMIDFQAQQPHFTREISEQPQVSPLVRFQAQADLPLTNRRHDLVNLDDEITHYLLPYLDGHHTQAALVDKLLALVEAGDLVLQRGDETLNVAQQREILDKVLRQSLTKLADNALLIG